MSEKYYIICIHHIFVHSSIDGQLDYFHHLASVNSAAINIHVQVFYLLSIVLDIYLARSGIAGSYGCSRFALNCVLSISYFWMFFLFVGQIQVIEVVMKKKN